MVDVNSIYYHTVCVLRKMSVILHDCVYVYDVCQSAIQTNA